MSSNEIEIRGPGGLLTGKIVFIEKPDHLHASRTAGGFNLSLPMKIMFREVAEDDPIPMISNLRGVIMANINSSSKIEVGRAKCESWSTGYVAYKGETGGMSESDLSMTWIGSFAELAHLERLRDGGSPKLDIVVQGELCYLINVPTARRRVRTQPQSVFSNYGSITVEYPKEVWVAMLTSIGAAENVLVEIPMPSTPPVPWNEVWKSLAEARQAFEQGGTPGWKACVTAVRVALEQWRRIEPEDMGPGWRNTPGNPQDRTKEQRLDNLRYHLHLATHHWVHNPAAMCTRDDALLMLSTFTGLLAENIRRP
jgi:hypothetical protein